MLFISASGIQIIIYALTIVTWSHFLLLLAPCGGNEFLPQRASNEELDIFFVVHLNKLLNKWSNCKSYILPRGFAHDDNEHLTDNNLWNSQWQQLSFTSICLTNWGHDKRAAILQTTFSNTFSSTKTIIFFIQIALYYVSKDWTKNVIIYSNNGLASHSQQAITWTTSGPFY